MDPEEDTQHGVALPSIKEVIAVRLPHFPRMIKCHDHHIQWLDSILSDFRQKLVDADDVFQFLSDFFSYPGEERAPVELHRVAALKDAWDHPGDADSLYRLYTRYLDDDTFLSKLLAICAFPRKSTFPRKSAHAHEESEKSVEWAKYTSWSYVVSYIICHPDVKPGIRDINIDRRIMCDEYLARAFPRTFASEWYQKFGCLIPGVTQVIYWPRIPNTRTDSVCKILGKTSVDFRHAAWMIAKEVASFHFYRGLVILIADGKVKRTRVSCDRALLRRVATAANLEEFIEECFTRLVNDADITQAQCDTNQFKEATARLPDQARFGEPFWRLMEAVLYRLFVSVPERDYASLYRYVDRSVNERDPIIDLPVRLMVNRDKTLTDLGLADAYREQRANGDLLEFAQALFVDWR